MVASACLPGPEGRAGLGDWWQVSGEAPPIQLLVNPFLPLSPLLSDEEDLLDWWHLKICTARSSVCMSSSFPPHYPLIDQVRHILQWQIIWMTCSPWCLIPLCSEIWSRSYDHARCKPAGFNVLKSTGLNQPYIQVANCITLRDNKCLIAVLVSAQPI